MFRKPLPFILNACFAFLLTVGPVRAVVSRVQFADPQLLSGAYDQTQIVGSGSDARVELLNRWETVTVPNPPAGRMSAGMAVDPVTGFAVLFGGDNGSNVFGDTWEFNPSNGSWTQRLPVSAPSARYGHAMAELGGGKILLFGGANDFAPACNNETWIYDTATRQWQDFTASLSSAPSARAFCAVARDAARGKVILFGGMDGSGTRMDDTWVFDIAASSWSFRSPAAPPAARRSAAMTYSSGSGLLYLFGGYTGAYMNDLWTYDAGANAWTNCNPGGTLPEARENPGLFYDARTARVVLFGGGAANDDLWYYNPLPGTNLWYKNSSLAPLPGIRNGHCLAYLPVPGKALLFGGRQYAAYLQDTSYYVFQSSGTLTTPVIDGGAVATSLQWMTLCIEPLTPPAGSDLVFQVSSSSDNITWGPYEGGDGDENAYYVTGGTRTLWSGHNNRRYLRHRLRLRSDQPPASPGVKTVITSYNIGPRAPVPSVPLQNGSTNFQQPYFTWGNATEPAPDGDTLTYRIDIDDQNGFASPLVSSAGIPAGMGGSTVWRPAVALEHGSWYWRVRANDGTVDGAWSETFRVYVDTLPPSAVTDLEADIGYGNGEARLSWTMPGDDGLLGDIQYGRWQVRCSSYPVATEAEYAAVAQAREGTISSSPGRREEAGITGLTGATTWYFSLKVFDESGNASGVSLTSPHAFVNAPPVVSIVTPAGGEDWSGLRSIEWTSGDPNPGDTRTFSLSVSSDGGASYPQLIAAGLAHGTTHYLWDTRATCDAPTHRIKVTATDQRGLSASSVSPADFTVVNPNEPPEVTITAPAAGETVSGLYSFQWSVSDPNATDTHAYVTAISSDGGSHYGWQFPGSTAFLAFDTRQLPNGPSYRLRVTVTDTGLPAGQDEAVRDFAVANGNLPPRAFSLRYPLNGSARSPLDFSIEWENTGDPNPEDTLIYTLYYSTEPAFSSGSVVSGLAGTSYLVNPASLLQETTYYWMVVAEDPFGLKTPSTQTNWTFVLSRFRAQSKDGNLSAEITAGLPDNGFLTVEQLDRSASGVIALADRDTLADRHLRALESAVYRVAVRTVDGSELDIPDVRAGLSLRYLDADGDRCWDGTPVPAGNLRVALLNEASGRWELPATLPSVDTAARRLFLTLERLGAVTVMGALAPSARLSGVVNYPNPFRAGAGQTRIRYVLTEHTDVSVRVYTLTGDLVWDNRYPAGAEGGRGQASGYTNEIAWDGRNKAGRAVANGMYLMELRAGGEKHIRKIGIVK